MYESMEDPGHAVNKLTRPYQWLRREAIGNLGVMQALGRASVTWQVLTPYQDEELESSAGSGSDTEMQDTDLISESEGSEGGDVDRREVGLTARRGWPDITLRAT
jgi:hypothetical protein